MHQLTVQPTWETALLSKRLKGRPTDFHIQLMDGVFKVFELLLVQMFLCVSKCLKWLHLMPYV